MSVEQDPASLTHASAQISAMLGEQPEPEGQPERPLPAAKPEPKQQANPEPEEPEYEPRDPEPEPDDEPEGEPEPQAKLVGDLVEIEIDGERYSVPAKLKDSFLRQSDYTRKTQEIANARKEIEAAKQAAFEQVDAETKTEVNRLRQLLGEQVAADANTDWQQLLETDPIEYLKRQRAAEERRTAYADMQAKWQQQQSQQLQVHLAREQEQLLAKLPEWKDDKVAAQAKRAIAEHLQSSGFSPEEIASVYDHRMLLIADKARKWDELQSQKGKVVQRVEKLPPKAERPGTASEARNNPSRESMQRLRKTGRMDDAVAALQSLMG